MPELPDIEIIVSNLRKQTVGKKIVKIRVTHKRKTKDSAEALSHNLIGQKITGVSRYGKELRFLFSNNQLLEIHLMKNGELLLYHSKNHHSHVIVEFSFNDGSGLALLRRIRKISMQIKKI